MARGDPGGKEDSGILRGNQVTASLLPHSKVLNDQKQNSVTIFRWEDVEIYNCIFVSNEENQAIYKYVFIG